MEACPWISITQEQEGLFCDHFHVPYDNAIAGLSPDSRPSFVGLVGRREKARILGKMLRQRSDVLPHKQIFLHRDPDSTTNLFVDCEAHNASGAGNLESIGFGPKSRKNVEHFDPQVHDSRYLAVSLYGRFLTNIADAILYFADDFRSHRELATLMAQQMTKPSSSDLPTTVRPVIIVVVNTHSTAFDQGSAEGLYRHKLYYAMKQLKSYQNDDEIREDMLQHCRDIRVLGLQSQWNLERRADIVHDCISTTVHDAQQRRRLSRVDFTVEHWRSFTSTLVSKLCSSIDPFSFIQSSRPWGFNHHEFSTHLAALLGLIPSQAWLWHFVCPLVSSALLIALYPPKSHFFLPAFLHQELFHPPCQEAIQLYSSHSDIQSKFLSTVETGLQALFDRLVSNSSAASSAKLHWQQISALRPYFHRFKSNITCFCCLLRMPEKTFSCGHAVCDTCIKIFGQRLAAEHNTYQVSNCLLCRDRPDKTVVFQYLPPTAGIRILSIDGGGVRGVIPLVLLNHLDKHFAPLGCSIRDFFDYICGTSAGGLVGIGIGIMEWDPVQCLQKFEQLANDTFGSALDQTPFGGIFKKLLASLLRDHKYDATNIEGAFEQKARLFNPLTNERKVAVTTTAVNDSAPCLMTNYNGGSRDLGQSQAGYRIIRDAPPEDAVSISEAARCTSAAPWFFKPTFIKHFGTFQDGGLMHNNPLAIAIQEHRLLWPGKQLPDFVLSIGTGTSVSSLPMKLSSPITDRFIPRLMGAFMKQTDGETAWEELSRILPRKLLSRIHRFNIKFQGPLPQMDNVSSMGTLKQETRIALTAAEPISSIIDSIYGSLFCLELDKPKYFKEGYACRGRIRFRLELTYVARRWLYRRMQETMAHFLIAGRPVLCISSPSILRRCPPYSRLIEFHVQSLDDIVQISLRGLVKSQIISGLPMSVGAILRMQGTDAAFGHVDHREQATAEVATIGKRKRAIS